MPVQRIDKGVGSVQTYTLNVPFTENVVALPSTVPTAEPDTSQFIYTVEDTDLLTISPMPVGGVGRTTPLIWLAGQMDVAAGTISYRLLYNGTSLTTGTTNSIAASNYFTLNAVNTGWSGNLKAGDVIEMRVWNAQANTTILYSSIGFYPSRLFLSKAPIVKDCYWLGAAAPIPTQGHSPSFVGDAFSIEFGRYFTSVRGSGVFSNYSTGNISWYDNNNSDTYMPFYIPEKNYGFGAIYFGDTGYLTTVSCRTHTTNWPQYERSPLPKTISFREIWFDR